MVITAQTNKPDSNERGQDDHPALETPEAVEKSRNSHPEDIIPAHIGDGKGSTLKDAFNGHGNGSTLKEAFNGHEVNLNQKIPLLRRDSHFQANFAQNATKHAKDKQAMASNMPDRPAKGINSNYVDLASHKDIKSNSLVQIAQRYKAQGRAYYPDNHAMRNDDYEEVKSLKSEGFNYVKSLFEDDIGTDEHSDANSANDSASLENNEITSNNIEAIELPQKPKKGQKAPKIGRIFIGEILDQDDKINIVMLANAVYKRFKIISIDNRLYIYIKPVYRSLSDLQFITKFRGICYNDVDEYTYDKWSKVLKYMQTDHSIEKTVESLPDLSNKTMFKNGLYDFETGEFEPASPKQYCFTFINHDFPCNLTKGNETEKFLNRISNGDASIRKLILELWGYCMYGKQRYRKFFLVLGPTASGKSKIGEIARHLVGQDYTSELKVSDFSKDFALSSMINMRLNVDFDCDSAQWSSRVSSLIKSLTSSEPIKVDVKNKSRHTLVNEAKLIICSNHFPETEDFDNSALMNRMILLPLMHSIPDNERDPDLLVKLKGEVPYIIYRSIEAFRAVLKRDKFTIVESGRAIIRENADPVSYFIEERCDVYPRASEPITKLDLDFKKFCLEFGFDYKKNALNKALQARGYIKKRLIIDGSKPHCFLGIQLRKHR